MGVKLGGQTYMRPAEDQNPPNPGDIMVIKLNTDLTCELQLFHDLTGFKVAEGTWMKCQSARTGPGEAMVFD